MQIRAAPAHKAFPLPAHHRQNLEQPISRLHPRVHQNFALQRHAPRLGQESKRKLCRQAEAVLAVASAPLEFQIHLRGGFRSRRQNRKVCTPFKNSRLPFRDKNSPQPPVRQLQPLLLPWPIQREGKRHRLPLPLHRRRLPVLVFLARSDYADGKCRQPAPRISQHDSPRHRPAGKQMLR